MINHNTPKRQKNNDRGCFFSPITVVIVYIAVMLGWIIFVDYDFFNLFNKIDNDLHFHENFFLLFSFFFIIILVRKHKHEIKRLTNYSDIVFSSSPSAIAIMRNNGSFVSVNTAFSTLLGYQEKEVEQQVNFFNLLPKNYHEKVLNAFKNKSNAEQVNISLRHKKGTLIDVSLKSKQTKRRYKTRTILFIDELSVIKQLHRELTLREAKFFKIFHFMPIGMQLLNIDSGERIEVNEKLCEITGYTYEELMASNFFTHALWQDDEQKNIALLQFKRDKKLTDYEAKFTTKQGKILTVLLNVTMFNSNDQSVALVSVNDISEYKNLVKMVKSVANDFYTFNLHKNEQELYSYTLENIANTFNSSYTLITCLHKKDEFNQNDNSAKMVTTVVNYHNETLQPTFQPPCNHTVVGTPREQVYNDNIVVLNEKVQQLFPQDHSFIKANITSYVGLPLFDLNNKVIGALELLFTDSIQLSDFQLDILQILAAKISNELKHKENNAKLSRSEQHLRLYKEQTPLASIEWDAEFNIIGWNIAAEKMFGYSLAEIQQLDFVKTLVPTAEQDKIAPLCDLFVQGIGGEFSINTIITKQGNAIITEWHNQTIRNDRNKIIGSTAIVINITEQQQAHQQLVKKEKDTKEILNTMTDAVFTINEHGIILSFNPAAETMFGYSSTQLLNRNISLLMPSLTAIHHNDYIVNYLQTGKANIIGIGREVTAQTAAGITFSIRLSIAELSPDDGIRRFIGTCQDLTEIKHQQALMDRYQKMDALGKLTGGVAHDFNNILGVIAGYSELLNRQLSKQPKLKQFTEQILKASHRGANLTKKLLSFSSKKSINPEVTNINECLLSIEDMLQKTLTASITLKCKLTEKLWSTTIAISAFEDALLNLALNAKDAMPNGGSLLISTTNIPLSNYTAEQYKIAVGDYICLTVEDNGSGMTNDVQQHLFDPFFTTKGDKGTGLGLAQVYGFIQATKGGINVYSELGKGSCFKLFLPRVLETSHAVEVALTENSPHSKPPNLVENLNKKFNTTTSFVETKTILVVDDEPALTELAQLMLASNGFYVRTANSANQALQILANKKVDLLLSDIIMPTMSGYQLAKRVQQLYPDVLIVFVSGFQGNDDEQKNELSHLPVITKPYSEVELLTTIKQLFAIKNTKNFIKNIYPSTLKQSTNSTILALHKQHEKIEQSIASLLKVNVISHDNANNVMLTKALSDFKEEFKQLIKTHFSAEEKLMTTLNYPHTKNHIEVHNLILKEFENAMLSNEISIIKNWLTDYLIPYFSDHIQMMDVTLENFIEENQAPPSSIVINKNRNHHE